MAGDQAGIVGFCMGGRLVLMTALANENLAVAAPFYGSPLTPEEAASVKAPVFGFYGADDGGIPVPDVLAMQEALTAAGIENEVPGLRRCASRLLQRYTRQLSTRGRSRRLDASAGRL